MHKRPKLSEAVSLLNSLASQSADAAEAVAEYNSMVSKGQEFLAARYAVEIVDHFYHLQGVKHG